jgi:hypothetical protein
VEETWAFNSIQVQVVTFVFAHLVVVIESVVQYSILVLTKIIVLPIFVKKVLVPNKTF